MHCALIENFEVFRRPNNCINCKSSYTVRIGCKHWLETHTHERSLAHTHARTHARTHTHTLKRKTKKQQCNWSKQPVWNQINKTEWPCKLDRSHEFCLKLLMFSMRQVSGDHVGHMWPQNHLNIFKSGLLAAANTQNQTLCQAVLDKKIVLCFHNVSQCKTCTLPELGHFWPQNYNSSKLGWEPLGDTWVIQ